MDTGLVEAALKNLRSTIHDRMSEDEVERQLEPLYKSLAYKEWGYDIRGKKRGANGVPDVLLLNTDKSVQVVVEVKNPKENLQDHEGQLKDYVRGLLAPWGLLTNGRDLWIYQGLGRSVSLVKRYTAESLEKEIESLRALEKQHLDLTDYQLVKDRLQRSREQGLQLKSIDDLPSHLFLESFDLAPGALFGELVVQTQNLLKSLHGRSAFVDGSYDFWKRVYARELKNDEKPPKIWLPLLEGKRKSDIYQLMFALETAYLLAARLILAKAVQDHDKDEKIVTSHMAGRLGDQIASLRTGRDGVVPITAYAQATENLFDEYAKTLFTSVYAQDLFDWWRDVEMADAAAQEGFCGALGRLIVNVVRFDFASLEGDLLGELYQRYFDPETRKALGEFYTPPEVVDFILDEVGYKGRGRILDPAAGSGTFLIHALRRYLKENERRDPVETLKGITESFQIVGFDVNPFAVMMAQVNFAAQLVPLYAKAVEKDPKLVLRRLPIVRTDSLRQELVEGEQKSAAVLQGAKGSSQMVGIDFGAEDVTAHIELPVKSGDGNLAVEITVPAMEAAKSKGLVRNEREWLLALQAVFAAVERRSQAFDQGGVSDLETDLRAEIALHEANPNDLSTYLLPYAEDVWTKLQDLKTHHGDGRFLKTLEDLMLGLVLKHYLRYQYVVGNPPYVKIQNIPDVLKKYWRDVYRWTTNKYDIYIPFVERAVAGSRPWLSVGGKLGYITPNRFLTLEYAEKLRKHFPQHATLDSITDFGAVIFAAPDEDKASRLFSEALVYPAVTIATKRDASKASGVRNGEFLVARFYPRHAPISPRNAIRALKEVYRAHGRGDDLVHLKAQSTNYADVFVQQGNHLGEGGWHLMPADERVVFAALERIGNSKDKSLPKRSDQKRRLFNYTSTKEGGFYGFITGLDKVFVVRTVDDDDGVSDLVRVTSRAEPDPFLIERGVLKPWVYGRDIARWRIGSSGQYVLFPYVKNKSGRYVLAPSAKYADKFDYSAAQLSSYAPKAWEYMLRHETELRGRLKGKTYDKGKSSEHRWYALQQTSYLDVVVETAHKLLFQTSAQSPEIAPDNSGYLFAGSGTHNTYGLLLNDSIDANVMAGLFASKVSEFYVKHVSEVFANGFYSYGDQFIRDLPVPNASPSQEALIAKLTQELTSLTAQAHYLSESIGGFPHTVTDLLRDGGRVPDLDDLARVGIAEKLPKKFALDRTMARVEAGNDTVIEVAKGRLTLSPRLAEFVLAACEDKGELEREAFLRLDVPITEADQQIYLQKRAEWKANLRMTRKRLAKLEDELSEATYVAYGFGSDRDSRRVIERYLESY